MPRIIHDLRITQEGRNEPGPHCGGLWVRTNDEIRELSDASGFPLWPHTPDNLRLVLEVDESDPRLAKLYKAIWEKYQLKPSPWTIIPTAERHRYFGVRRKPTWTKQELDASELLWLKNTLIIGTNKDATPEEWAREDYVAAVDSKQNSKTQFGSLSPFMALAVAEPLRSQVLDAGLTGLHLPPVVFVPRSKPVRKPLWALRSSVMLPRAGNLLQGEHGNEVEPNTEWACMWDDGGMYPPVLHYQRAEIEQLGRFDIALTYERVGITVQGAFRQCIVSQRFREVFATLNVKGVTYVPVDVA